MADLSIKLDDSNTRFKSLDVNNDGKIDKEDSKVAQSSGQTSTANQITDLIGKDEEPTIETTDTNKAQGKDTSETTGSTKRPGISNTINGIVTTEENKETEAVEEIDKAETEETEGSKEIDQEVLDKIKDIGSSSSAAEIGEAIGVLKTYMDGLDAEIKVLDEELGKLQASYDTKLKEKEANEAAYEALAKKLDAETDDLNQAIKNSEDKAESEAEIQQSGVRDAVKRATANFNGQKEGEDKPLNGFIQTELSGIPEMQSVDQTLITGMSSRISGIALEMDTVAKRIETNVAELGQIKTDMDGKQALRNTKTAQKETAKTKSDELQTLKEQKEAEEAAKKEAAKKCDPIGYTDKQGNRFDFVVDRDKDGIFDGANEFLGAKDQWNEMQNLDADKDGVVEKDELKGVKLLKTDQNGQQSFIDAGSTGVEIDLSTYQKAKDGTMKGEGQELLGTYNVNSNGEQLSGYNTLDDMSYLDKEYGKSYNTSLNGNNTQTNDKSGNIDKNFAKTVKPNAADLQFTKVDNETLLKNIRTNVTASADLVKTLEETTAGEKSDASGLDEEAKTTKKKDEPKTAAKDTTKEPEQPSNPFKKQKTEP